MMGLTISCLPFFLGVGGRCPIFVGPFGSLDFFRG